MGSNEHPEERQLKVRRSFPFPQLRAISQLKIGHRLALSFSFLFLLILTADMIALWQFHEVQIQTQRLNNINRKSISVLELHTALLQFRDRLKAVATGEDLYSFSAEAKAQKEQLLADTEYSRQLLLGSGDSSPADPMVLSALQAIQTALPDQIDTMITLSEQGDWNAVRLRLEDQTKDLVLYSSFLVAQVDRQVAEERKVANDKIQSSQEWVAWVFPLTGLLTLLTAAVLGILVTRSITRPLAKLDSGAQAWARGDFSYQVEAQGKDELATLGQVFNEASQKLRELYEALSRKEARFRSLIEHSSDVIVLLEKDGTIRYASPSSERIIGLAPDALLSKNIREFVFPQDHSIVQQLLSEQVSGTIASAELRLTKADGSIRVLEAISSNLLDDPATAAIVLNARDITERKQAEEAVTTSEQKYRSFFERNLAGSYIATPEGSILECNPALVRMFGFASAEELKKINLFECQTSEERRKSFLEEIRTRKRIESREEEYLRKDGSTLPVVTNAIGRFDRHGQLVEVSGFLIDETERRKTERHLLHAQKMEAVGRLAGGIAHDFNNLLGVILGASSLLLQKEELPETVRHEIQEIRNASHHAAALTRQLLAFSRKQVLQPTVINLNVVLENVGAIIRRLLGEDIQISTVLAPDLSFVRADLSQIEQVLLNLCVNSRDAMPHGGRITIETSDMEGELASQLENIPMNPGKYVRLCISDTGLGMDKVTLAHIFEPFFTTKGAEKGTGLGLSTVYGIVKQSGGYISAYSELGHGTTMTVYLPAVVNPPVPATNIQELTHPHHGSETILLVEDAAQLRTLTTKILESCGYHVLAAADPLEALDIFEHDHEIIDLLLTDVIMPHMSGPVLAEQLLARVPDLKVLFISGYTDDAIEKSGLIHPGSTLLEKPFTMQALTERIRAILGTEKPRSAESRYWDKQTKG